MKRLAFILVIVSMIVLAGCGKDEKLTLDSKHKELPDYVKNTSELIQETYIMAATYPEVLASVPCYCGCGSTDGHVSNLDCFVGGMDKNNAVVEWDQMGVA
ncbi:hypothetical protein HHO41_16040 [Bacillus sp. DNRA2]|nr:hypothetical protein [Bacillus sp. DNRA2]